MKTCRCAIYTRKSSEEGLDQSFLHAQREACEAYITSQKHEDWHTLSAKYDDGGFCGGNMVRPGLKKLLEDIAANKIDTVVVYKVDRFTRSLADCRHHRSVPVSVTAYDLASASNGDRHL
jgi:site-specific DNA recombinase